jgi:asparagine synthase (glutamine-hydrolysing)
MSSATRYSSYVRVFDDAQIRELLVDPELDSLDPIAARFLVMNEDRDVVESALAVDRATYLPGDLLMKVDRASMLHALEVRSPFMDHELVSYAASFTTSDLLAGGGKRMLREAFAADLPDFVFKRPKMGFALPIGDWLRTELKPMCMDMLGSARSFARRHFQAAVVNRLVNQHMSGDADHTHRLFALLMLELWNAEFGT